MARSALVHAALLLALPVALRAQQPAPRPPAPARMDPASPVDSGAVHPDSLAARLARAEAAIRLLREQLAAEEASRVRTRSRLQLEFTGRFVTNAFANSRRVNNPDVPQYVLPPVPALRRERTLGLALRQSVVGVALVVDDVLGGTLDADADVDFFGRFQTAPGDRPLFPEPRLRTTRAWLRWPRTELMVGLETPLIADLNPVSLAAFGTPEFATAGNLWNWIPQIRASQTLVHGRVRAGVTGGVLEPFSTERYQADPDQLDAGERSGRPYLQARAWARWGGEERPSEVGVGAHRGWVALAGDTLSASGAVAADLHLWLAPRLELRAEAYAGHLVRGLGGGGIGQNFGQGATPTDRGPVLDARGGWAQLNARLHPTLEGGLGCGIDDPRDSDRPLRRRNQVCAAHAIWRPVGPLLLGVAFRRLATKYAADDYTSQHLNLALGFEL